MKNVRLNIMSISICLTRNKQNYEIREYTNLEKYHIMINNKTNDRSNPDF